MRPPITLLNLITDRTAENVNRLEKLSAKGWSNMTMLDRVEWKFGAPDMSIRFVGGENLVLKDGIAELYGITWSDGEIVQLLDGTLVLYTDTVSNKGAYNAADLNRVEQATSDLREEINGMQKRITAYRTEAFVANDTIFSVPFSQIGDITTKTDWEVKDIPNDESLERYLTNVDTVTDPISIAKDLPESMDDLGYEEANNIEMALLLEYKAALALEAEKKTLIDNTAKAFIYSGEVYAGEF